MMASNSALGVVPMHWRTTSICSHCGLYLMGMYVCMYVSSMILTHDDDDDDDDDDVCMYVCMYVRTYIRMYVCLYVCTEAVFHC